MAVGRSPSNNYLNNKKIATAIPNPKPVPLASFIYTFKLW